MIISAGQTDYKLEKDFTFPAGELQIKLPQLIISDSALIEVTTTVRSSNDLIKILLVSDALSHYYPNNQKVLNLGYLPYSRQDRRCCEGESFSSEVINNLLSDTCFNPIYVVDVHSSNKLPTNFIGLSIYDLLKSNKLISSFDVFVAPDKGSINKVTKLANFLGKPVVIANKKRDIETGWITDVTIIQGQELIKGNSLLVIDDICDGGLTFNLLAKKLDQYKPINKHLYVTHGVFSKGLSELLVNYSRIITTDSYCKLTHKRLDTIKIQEYSK